MATLLALVVAGTVLVLRRTVLTTSEFEYYVVGLCVLWLIIEGVTKWLGAKREEE